MSAQEPTTTVTMSTHVDLKWAWPVVKTRWETTRVSVAVGLRTTAAQEPAQVHPRKLLSSFLKTKLSFNSNLK